MPSSEQDQAESNQGEQPVAPPVRSPYAPPEAAPPSMSHHHDGDVVVVEDSARTRSTTETKKQKRRLAIFNSVLLIDLVVSCVVVLVPYLNHYVTGSHASRKFVFEVWDLWLLAGLRTISAWIALLVSYSRAMPRESPFELYHPNGEKKTRDELDEEALEEPFGPWFVRFLKRSAFFPEGVCLATQILCVIKCLWRMDVELATLPNSGVHDPYHPFFWLFVLWATVLAVIEASALDHTCQVAAEYGKGRRPAFFRTISSTLSLPLLAGNAQDGDNEHDIEQGSNVNTDGNGNDTEVRGVSDISADSHYKATWADLILMCKQDLPLLTFAFIFLLLAAIAQTLIPLYLGHILDALSKTFNNENDDDDDPSRNDSMFQVPGFAKNVKLLVLVSIAAGVFAGLRGSIFTVVGGRVNVRLRIQLMDSLLAQDIGFFDVTKTGDITSRLSSDTTLVGDQVMLNVNVFLRSLVQAIGVLGFMFMVSWQLSILAFISVPLVTLLSKWYGNYVRSLTKLMQKKLADGNSVSESVLSTMPTVRAFDAAEIELKEFEACMKRYLVLNTRSAIAYCGYAAFTTSLPQLVFAVVVFYGGLLVRNGALTGGQLVSFILYLSSLSDAFSSIGWVYSSLTQAVGAADKVFELLHRKPRITPPSQTDPEHASSRRSDIIGIETSKTSNQRTRGLHPETVRGEIELQNVTLYYPARPQRRILNGLSLKIEPGSTVALVGQSGGGKSSVMSLIQHLYEQNSGRVLFDGIDVHELSPSWLSKHVSIVSQEPVLCGRRSIKQNIMYGLEGTDMEPSQQQIEEAARLANADSFIQNMPQKYDTEVGERGVQLSGGQKQRIAIARALVRNPRVLLLDEATSALDAESEHLVQKAIDDMLARGKGGSGESAMTVIIVAHRLSTVRSADRIFVIKEGKVVEQGSHDELVKDTHGAYSSLIRRQMQAQQKLEGGHESPTRRKSKIPHLKDSPKKNQE